MVVVMLLLLLLLLLLALLTMLLTVMHGPEAGRYLLQAAAVGCMASHVAACEHWQGVTPCCAQCTRPCAATRHMG